MHLWKRTLLAAYYHGSLPWRMWTSVRDGWAGQAPVIVLFYHRIADDRANDWTMSLDMFVGQMRWLRDRFDLVSLAEAQQRIRGGANGRTAVSVTFDDGYAENMEAALPLLVREKIPCTYFVATNAVLSGQPFPHDVARGRFFAPNSLDDLRRLADAGIEIGAHTRTHADLATVLNPAHLYDEIVTAGQDLEAALRRPIRFFSFPYGLHSNLSPEAFLLAKEAGYEAVCSAYGGYNFPGDDAFHLLRVHADDDWLRFKNWLTVDPRKRRTPRFAYETRPALSLAGVES